MQDASDPTIGFLLDGIDKLCCLVRKYIAGQIVLCNVSIFEMTFLEIVYSFTALGTIERYYIYQCYCSFILDMFGTFLQSSCASD